MAARNITLLSVDEFLDHEERSDTKNFYYDGVITAMAGGSAPHAFLAMNLGGGVAECTSRQAVPGGWE